MRYLISQIDLDVPLICVGFQKNMKQFSLFSLFVTLWLIRNVFWALNQDIMISEASCDTDDWSNDCW